MSRWALDDQDVTTLLGVLEQPPTADADEIFYPEVLLGLRALIPCDDLTFQLMEVSTQQVTTLTATDEGVHQDHGVGAQDAFTEVFWQEFWHDSGCAGPLRTGDHTTVLRRSDRWGDRQYAATPIGAAFAKLGVTHEVLVPMAACGVTDRRLLLFRTGGPDFTDRELAILRLARPHVAELHIRHGRQVAGEPELTPRQWEILRRVATGAGNTQIARALGVSEATVRKHLENIFVRLHVLSRTEAVARVRPFLDAA